MAWCLNDRDYRNTMRRLKSQARPTAQVAVRELAAVILRDVVHQAQTEANDTGRYKRAYELAHNQLGVGALPVTTPRESSYWQANKQRIEEQLRRIEKRIANQERQLEVWNDRASSNWGISSGRETGALKIVTKIEEELARLRRVRKRAIQIVEQTDAAPAGTVVIFGRGGGRHRWSNQKLITIRPRLYGGSATQFDLAGTPAVRIVNAEPHARIVEFHKGLMRKSLFSARATGLRRVSATYVRRMQATAGAPGRKSA